MLEPLYPAHASRPVEQLRLEPALPHVCDDDCIADVIEHCWYCGGEGSFDRYDEDPVNYSPGEEFERCPECLGEGVFKRCING